MKNENKNYDDIINMEHHISKNHPRMDISDRAAQFMPFSALTGYDEAIKETERLTENFIELDEYEKTRLDRKLFEIQSNICNHPQITITHFKSDEKKEGGHYCKYTGNVKKIDEYKKTIKFDDNTEIKIKNIVDIDNSLK